MDPSSANSPEHQREAIDAEIKSLEESIRALKYRRNALAPISSLPPEVTTLIFSFSRATSSTFIPCKKPDPLAWLRVAHVCHQWREIALNQPLFWSHVDFIKLSPAGAAEVLARAKTAPLYLEARFLGRDWDNARFNAFREELQARVSDIRHLLISADQYQLTNTLESLTSPAPTLERLSLTGEPQLPEAIPGTLFGGTTPRLACLELRDCGIFWGSPLLRGLSYLDIRSPCAISVPSHSVWLDALDEMPQLKMLTLRRASPKAGPFPFDVKRTVTLPSLTHFDIADSPRDCAFALAHLDLPALTCLAVKTFSCLVDGIDVRDVLPYIPQHAHGSQDTQPLQSVLIRGNRRGADILAWPVPNIDLEVHGSTLLAATTPARVALSLWSKVRGDRFDTQNEIFGMAMAAIPLDGLVRLITQESLKPPFDKFWLPNLPRYPLLQHMRLASNAVTKFIDWLQADEGGRENPLLPSLKELVLANACLSEDWTLHLCEALMKRVEQGVPVEMLDLRTCCLDFASAYLAAVRLLGEIVVDVLGPDETIHPVMQIMSMLDRAHSDSFVGHNSGEEFDTDNDDSDSDTSGDDEDDDDDDDE